MRHLQLTKKRKIILGLIITILITIPLMGQSCDDTYNYDRDRQTTIMEMGQEAVPIPEIENFLARQAIAEYMERMDTPNKLWYIYVYADSGAFLGYFISRTYPISISVAMSNPVRYFENGATLPAPGIDAVYYNGVDPVLYYFFDASTNAMCLLRGELWLAFDAPLALDVPQLKIETTNHAGNNTVEK
jgi:hypothetical protein